MTVVLSSGSDVEPASLFQLAHDMQKQLVVRFSLDPSQGQRVSRVLSKLDYLTRRPSSPMLRTSHELLRHDIEASDGAIGIIRDFLFDDRTWSVSSIVVDTDGLLAHHDVLIDPCHVAELRFPEESMVLDLTKREVENSADAASTLPVSRQLGGDQAADGGPNLRSAREVISYRVMAKDASMGDIRDFVIDTSTWTMRYLVVDTGEWLSNKLVLLSPRAVTGIAWPDKSIQTDLTADAIRHCPAYDGHAELTRDYEAFLHDYYGWPQYWS